MLCDKKTSAPAICLLLVLSFVLAGILGCAQNSGGVGSNYEDILNEAAHERTKPTPEVVTGTVSFAQNDGGKPKTEPTTAATAKAEEVSEVSEITETPAAEEDQAVLFVITQSGKKYHLQSCYMVKSIKQYFTKEEAEQSKYEPCKICKPE